MRKAAKAAQADMKKAMKAVKPKLYVWLGKSGVISGFLNLLTGSSSSIPGPPIFLSIPVSPISIDVGGGPSGPSIEGPFCHTVHLCRTLEEKKIGKKKENKEK